MPGTLCGPVAEAVEDRAGFLPALDNDQVDRFTPSELRLYPADTLKTTAY